MKTIKHIDDLRWTVVFDPHSHWVEFEIYEIQGRAEDESRLYAGADLKNAPLDEAVPTIKGYVKWDGCSNWQFPLGDSCCFHGCERKDLLSFGFIMAHCWDITKELLPNFDQ